MRQLVFGIILRPVVGIFIVLFVKGLENIGFMNLASEGGEHFPKLYQNHVKVALTGGKLGEQTGTQDTVKRTVRGILSDELHHMGEGE